MKGMGGYDNLTWVGNINNNNPNFSFYETIYKTSAPINEPESGFMSELRIWELSFEHDIDYKLLSIIDMTLDDGKKLYMDDYYFYAEKYLISAGEDSFMFLATSMNVDGEFNEVEEIMYKIEKVGSEWVRTIFIV
jgi:hypothetical protein